MNTTKNQTALLAGLYAVLPLAGSASILATGALITGCKDSAQPVRATIIDNNRGNDPSDANLAPVSVPATSSAPRPAGEKVRALGAQQSYTPQQSSEQYGQPAAPIEYKTPSQAYDTSQQADNGAANTYDSGEAAGFEALADASQPPPPLPEYDQPPVPEPNDLWTPGYWNYAPQGYFWVPGAWVAPPYAGALWTPGYWGYDGGRYRLHRGYWARHIGFYGGVNYGFGYTGTGYRGGYWNGNDFFYNRTVNRVNITNIHNVYERNITVNNTTRISYNGGNGGIQTRPGPQELAVLREQRTPPMATQVQLREASFQNRQQFYNENHGRPAEAFVAHPIAAERGMQTVSVQALQQQNQHPQPLNPASNQQRMNNQQPQRPDQQREQQRAEQQHLEQLHQTPQNQPPSRFQSQSQQLPQTSAQPRFEPHTNHQEPANPHQRLPQSAQQDELQQRQRLQQEQQGVQQRLPQPQRTSPEQSAPQRSAQPQRTQQSQPQQSQPRSEVQPRPQQTLSPQPQQQPHLQAQPQSHPQPQSQPHQEAQRAEPHNSGRPNR